MKQQRNSYLSPKTAGMALALVGLGGLLGGAGEAQAQVSTSAIINGVIDRITIDNKNDTWSSGTIEVGGQKVIIPRNLLMDLPANRLTLQQFMAQAPGLCPLFNPPQSGLARADSPSCNTSGQPGYALINANRTSNGNVIAGDVFIQKGVEVLQGTVNFIDYNNGYFRMNGNPGDSTTGVMVRLNDPTGRHTVQPTNPLFGCLAGSPNCSADPRFTLDPDNYTNVFTTGFPLCIPSTQVRTFTDVLGLGTTVARAQADGTGDVLCPTTNRSVNLGLPVDDSRRFAPMMLGDTVTAEGNFERIGPVRFLLSHTIMVAKALTTKNLADQPDYLFMDEAFIDLPGFQNQRIRSLFIGFATKQPEDVLFWSLHYDPVTNARHELPLASIAGCDIAAGPGTCSNQGIAGLTSIFRVRHDIDFLTGAKPRLNPCAHLIADAARFGGPIPCNNNAGQLNLVDMMGILSPIPHEIQARTGHALANPGQITLDVNGNVATHGQYLMPFGIGLGGIDINNFFEVNLDAVQTPLFFSAAPWNLDRRLSPGGCPTPADCAGGPKPLDPFPFENLDPRTQASVPLGAYTDAAFTQSSLPRVADRILSFVDGTGRANGSSTVLTWPPANPVPFPITPVVDIPGVNLPPTITSLPVLTAKAAPATLYQYQVVATDDGGPANLTYSLENSPPSGMSISATGLITWLPAANQAPAQGLTVKVLDSGGLYDKQGYLISVNGAPSFVNVPASSAAKVGQLYVYAPFGTDPNLPNDTQTFALANPPAGTAPLGTTTINPATGRFTWIPTVGQVGPRTFSLRVTDSSGATQLRTFNVTVAP